MVAYMGCRKTNKKITIYTFWLRRSGGYMHSFIILSLIVLFDMSDCPNNNTGHELEYKQMFGKMDDPFRVKQRANCIHCQERMWVIYERSHVESCSNDERGFPLATEITKSGNFVASK